MVFGVVMKMPEYDRNKLQEIVLEHIRLDARLKEEKLTGEQRQEILDQIKALIEERDRMLSINYQ